MKLTIVVPAYNEEHRIGRMLDAYLPFFTEKYADDVEFIVVVNGSTDDTVKVVTEFCEKYPQLRVVLEPRPIGKGGAVMEGFGGARGELVGYVDADGSTPPEAFSDLVEHADDVPAIIASRWIRGAVVRPKQPLIRRVASRVFNLMTHLLFGLKVHDTQCGAKVFHKDVIDAAAPHIGITKWAFDVDLLFQVRRAGFAIAEIPTTWSDVEGSKIAVTESSLEMLAALVRLRLVYSPFKVIVTFYDRFLGGAGSSDKLLRHSFLVGLGSQVSNGANTVFQIMMAHLLVGKDAVEYGVMASMLGTIVLMSIPLGAVGRSVSHFAALACRDGNRDLILPMTRALTRDLALAVSVSIVLVMLFVDELAEGFHLTNSQPIVIMVFTIAIQVLQPVYTGVLGGIQAFRSTALLGAFQSTLRLLGGGLLVISGFGAVGALLGNLLGAALSLAIGMLLVLRMVPASPIRLRRPAGFYRYVLSFALAMAGFALLTSSDVVLVKRFFSPDVAGEYALAAMIARIVFFLPMPIAAAMFPKVVSDSGRTESGRRTFRKALVATIGCFLIPAVMLEMLPGLFLHLLTGASGDQLIRLIRLLVVVYLPFPILLLILQYELAQTRVFRVAIPMILAGCAYVLAAKFLDGGVARVALSLGVAAYACVAWFSLGGIGLFKKAIVGPEVVAQGAS